MATIEAVERRRANRAAARRAKEQRQHGVKYIPQRPSGHQRAVDRQLWEQRVAERMAERLDPIGEVGPSRRGDYRYWQCRASGFDPDAAIIGWTYGSRVIPSTVYRGRHGVVENATVYDWWIDLHPESREQLRRDPAIRDETGQLFSQLNF